MMDAPVIVQPDLEAHVYDALKALGGVDSFAYTAVQRWPGWIMAHFVQVDARAKRKQAARDLAEQARQILMALPDRPWADGAVCYVDAVEGPFWLPDEDGSPRYVARYEVRVHPRRSPPDGLRPAL
jgi:hypothetical protein